MKYKKEIDELFEELFFEEWMTTDDYEEVVDAFNRAGYTKQRFSDEIDVGIKNGYSIETQFELIRQINFLKDTNN